MVTSDPWKLLSSSLGSKVMVIGQEGFLGDSRVVQVDMARKLGESVVILIIFKTPGVLV